MLNVTTKLSSINGVLFKLKNKVDQDTRLMIYRSLAESLLLHINIIWAWKNCKNLKKLQICQNRLLKCVYNLPYRFPTELLYKIKKGIIEVNDINVFQSCLYIFKSLKFPFPGAVVPDRATHEHFTRFRELPRTNLNNKATVCQRITTHGVQLFNDLSVDIRNSSTIVEFKRKMYDHLQGELLSN